MVSIKNLLIQGKHKRPIIADIFYNKTNTPKPLFIFCHGYKGYKDWGVFGIMEKKIVENNIAFLRFNFSFNGGTKNEPIDFPDLEAFGNNNYSKELDDLKTVIDWIFKAKEHHIEIDVNQVTLVGHSRGGGIATLMASRDFRVKKLITWAAVSTLDRSFFHGKELIDWKKTGVLHVQNGRTKQQMPHYIQFYEDYVQNKEQLNLKKACDKINIPHLIIHGSQDEAVPFFHAENLHSWNPKSKLLNILNANHVFGAKQPWTEDKFPKEFEIVLEKTLSFLKI